MPPDEPKIFQENQTWEKCSMILRKDSNTLVYMLYVQSYSHCMTDTARTNFAYFYLILVNNVNCKCCLQFVNYLLFFCFTIFNFKIKIHFQNFHDNEHESLHRNNTDNINLITNNNLINCPNWNKFYIWAVSRQNQHTSKGFATSMDPDQPAHPCSLIRIHAVCYQFLYL
jgi:hypothetical protein